MTTATSYHCDLCEAREKNCHPWELFWGADELPSRLLRDDPDYPDIRQPIYHYENVARCRGWKPSWERGAPPTTEKPQVIPYGWKPSWERGGPPKV